MENWKEDWVFLKTKCSRITLFLREGNIWEFWIIIKRNVQINKHWTIKLFCRQEINFNRDIFMKWMTNRTEGCHILSAKLVAKLRLRLEANPVIVVTIREENEFFLWILCMLGTLKEHKYFGCVALKMKQKQKELGVLRGRKSEKT